MLGRNSIAALCVSKDKHFNKYFTTIRKQPPRTELLITDQHDNITSMIDEVMINNNIIVSILIDFMF